jgi:hypothetical protein
MKKKSELKHNINNSIQKLEMIFDILLSENSDFPIPKEKIREDAIVEIKFLESTLKALD